MRRTILSGPCTHTTNTDVRMIFRRRECRTGRKRLEPERVEGNDCGAPGDSPVRLFFCLQKLTKGRLVLLCRFALLFPICHNQLRPRSADPLTSQGLYGRDRAEALLFLL